MSQNGPSFLFYDNSFSWFLSRPTVDFCLNYHFKGNQNHTRIVKYLTFSLVSPLNIWRIWNRKIFDILLFIVVVWRGYASLTWELGFFFLHWLFLFCLLKKNITLHVNRCIRFIFCGINFDKIDFVKFMFENYYPLCAVWTLSQALV